jgi:SAM-dependent methyltransferase
MANPAEGYESYMVPPLFGPWAARLVADAAPAPGERVVDVGCGTGIVAREVTRARPAGGPVEALDASPDMLAVARAAAEREGATGIAWHEGRAEHLPWPDRSVDVVLSQFALMFIGDRPRALAEMRRVVRDSGRVLLSVWQGLDRHPFYDTLRRVIERRLGVSALQDIFALGDAEELRGLAAAVGFGRVRVEPRAMVSRFPNPGGFLAGEIEVDTAAIPAMQHLDAEARRAMVAAISADMADALSGVTRDDHVVLEFHAHILTARP